MEKRDAVRIWHRGSPGFSADGSKDALIIFSVALANFMARLDSYIVNVSLPTMARYFGSSLSEVSRIVFLYVLAVSSTLLLFGKMGDRMGLKRFFLWGYIIFTGGSLLCGLSANITMLTVFRFVQGLGSSMLAATSLAIISRHISPEKTGRAFGIFTSASALGITLGAPLGGFITEYISWHWIFFINVPIGIAAIIIAGKVIPGKVLHKQDLDIPRFDYPGAFLILAAISLLLLALNFGQERGWTSTEIVSGFLLSLLCGFLFFLREKRAISPIIDMSLFFSPPLFFPLLGNFIMYLTIAAHNFLIPFYLDLLKHMSPATIGFFLMIYSIVFVVVPSFAGKYCDDRNSAYISILAMFVTAFSFFFFSFTLHLGGLLFVIIFFVVRAVGNGMFIPPNNILIMKDSSEEDKGGISGMLNTVTSLGVTIGVVLFETIFSQIIHKAGGDHTLSGPGFSPANLQSGFRYVFLLLGFISVVGIIVAFLTPTDAKRKIREVSV